MYGSTVYDSVIWDNELNKNETQLPAHRNKEICFYSRTNRLKVKCFLISTGSGFLLKTTFCINPYNAYAYILGYPGRLSGNALWPKWFVSHLRC